MPARKAVPMRMFRMRDEPPRLRRRRAAVHPFRSTRPEYTVAGVVKDRILALAVTACALWSAVPVWAHDIPNDVTVHVLLKPDGQRVQVLVRAPLKAMRDVEYPMRGADRLDVGRADAILHDAATIWLVNNIDLYEGDTGLGGARIAAVRASQPADKSFASFDAALAHLTGDPLPADTELFWSQGLIDVLIEYPSSPIGQSSRSTRGLRVSASGR